MRIVLRVRYETLALLFLLSTIAAAIVASSACIFLILHDGGDEAILPEHMQV